MRFLPASDKALLVELDDLAQTMALYRHVAAQRLPGVQELVPAARTLLVHFEPHVISPSSLIDILRALGAQAAQEQQSAEAVQGRLVDIPVRYTGEDLPDVA
ncbi:MAG: carboxyltransferase domain-containing protein, partial [Comamonas sp.]